MYEPAKMKGNVICVLMVAMWFPEVEIAAVPLVDVDIWADTVTSEERTNASGFLSEKDFNRLPRVLNFFPVPFVEECKSNDGRRRGICMNTYECRIQEGKSHGFCAYGFGVCCVFTATCEQEVFNNLTYFVNPNYPDLTTGMSSCEVKVKKIDPEVVQIRFDFIHFNLGQPNRMTGVCDQDKFTIKSTTGSEITLCGVNSGQHLYFNVENLEEIDLSMTLSKKAVARFWEVVITQVSFAEQPPPGCLQYHTGTSGTVQTMNFADNGRHLADQDYNICIRQEEGYCSIAYEPCHENAFRIAPNSEVAEIDTVAEEGSGDDAFEEFTRAIDFCNDKIVLPCDSEELLMMPEYLGLQAGSCTSTHCGSSLCQSEDFPCQIETSVLPFNIGVHFGQNIKESSPEDNLGMCLNYEQIPCND